MKKNLMPLCAVVVLLAACSKTDFQENSARDVSLAKKSTTLSVQQIGMKTFGAVAAAEVSAFDPATKKLFVVNNTDGNNRISVLDLSNPASPADLTDILIGSGAVNSVAVSNGRLAAAVEASNKQMPGAVIVYSTTDYSVMATIPVGALPDMVTFSPDGRYILSANEGEPSSDYLTDPEGSVSIIDTWNGYAATHLNFAGFESMKTELMAKGLRIFGPNASFAQDIEPEYVAVSANSETAWVSLQENNAIARIDLLSKTITHVLPLGFKNHMLPGNELDPSDRPTGSMFGNFGNWPVYGMYQPDAIALNVQGNQPFVYTANEGDARDYSAFSEEVRVGAGSVVLDPTVFANAAVLKNNNNLGRYNITNTMGDLDGDGDYDALFGYGARSISVWHGESGKLIFDSGNEIDFQATQNLSTAELISLDGRSDNKGSEPEGLVVGQVNGRTYLFVGLERADAVMIYDISNPVKPQFVAWKNAGDAPEGLAFVSAADSPTGKALLVVSCEGDSGDPKPDGVVVIYELN